MGLSSSWNTCNQVKSGSKSTKLNPLMCAVVWSFFDHPSMSNLFMSQAIKKKKESDLMMNGLWTSIMMRRSDRMWPCWLVSMMWRFFSTLRAKERCVSFFNCTWTRSAQNGRAELAVLRYQQLQTPLTCTICLILTSSTRLKPPIPRVQIVLKSLSDTLEKKSASACSLRGLKRKN